MSDYLTVAEVYLMQHRLTELFGGLLVQHTVLQGRVQQVIFVSLLIIMLMGIEFRKFLVGVTQGGFGLKLFR